MNISRKAEVPDDRALQVFTNVKEAGSAGALEPFVIGASGEVDTEGLDVYGHAAGGLNNVGIQIGVMGVGQVAEPFGVLYPTVHVGNKRNGDETRLVVHDLRHIAHFDLPIAVLHNADVHARLAATDVVVHGAGVMEIVRDQIAARFLDLEAIDNRGLASLRTGYESNLRRFGIDQLCEKELGLPHGFVGVLTAPLGGSVHVEIHVAAHAFGGIFGQRHVGRRIEVNL